MDKIGELSNSYVKTMAIIINSAINYAVEKDFRVPLKAKIQKPQVDRKEVNVLSQKVQKQLEDTLIYDNSKTALGKMKFHCYKHLFHCSHRYKHRLCNWMFLLFL